MIRALFNHKVNQMVINKLDECGRVYDNIQVCDTCQDEWAEVEYAEDVLTRGRYVPVHHYIDELQYLDVICTDCLEGNYTLSSAWIGAAYGQ